MNAQRRTYSPEVKEAVRLGLLTGQSMADLATTYNVPLSTVKSWKARGFGHPASIPAGQPAEPDPARLPPPAARISREIGEQMVSYIMEAIHALRAQMNVIGDETWLRQQRASEIAILYRTLADKVVELLAAIEAGVEQEAAQENLSLEDVAQAAAAIPRPY